ncbi:hypothetical protein D3C76_1665460 [compost metagenome]
MGQYFCTDQFENVQEWVEQQHWHHCLRQVRGWKQYARDEVEWEKGHANDDFHAGKGVGYQGKEHAQAKGE